MTDAELRELDAEIHREVMGLGEACVCGQGVNVYDPDTGRCRRCGNLTCGRYSRDIRAAWLVVEKLKGEGLCLQLESDAGGCSACFQKWAIGAADVYAHVDGDPGTEAATICRAALQAVRGRDAGGG